MNMSLFNLIAYTSFFIATVGRCLISKSLLLKISRCLNISRQFWQWCSTLERIPSYWNCYNIFLSSLITTIVSFKYLDMTFGISVRKKTQSLKEDKIYSNLILTTELDLLIVGVVEVKDYFGLKCILSYYVPVQTLVSPYDANCVTPLIYPTTDLDFLFGIIVSFDLSFYFLFFWNLHTTFL